MIEANKFQESKPLGLRSELNQVTGEFKSSQEILIDQYLERLNGAPNQYGELKKLNNKLESLSAELATIKNEIIELRYQIRQVDVFKEMDAKQQEIRASLKMLHSWENEIIELRYQIRQVEILKKLKEMDATQQEIRTSLKIAQFLENEIAELRYQIRQI